jgi:hypothetical protein
MVIDHLNSLYVLWFIQTISKVLKMVEGINNQPHY